MAAKDTMETMLTDITGYLILVVSTTFSQLFILLGPGLILALVMNFVSDFARNRASDVFGDRFFIYFTAPGTIIHELGHAIFALIFGHEIAEIKLFSPDEYGTLGYVHHRYKSGNLYQNIGNFFIGIGPIILGSLVIFFAARYTVGNEIFAPLSDIQISFQTFSSFQNLGSFLGDVLQHALQVIAALFDLENFSNIWFYVFVYLVFSIGMHMKLSGSDLASAWSGFALVITLFFLFNLVTLWMGEFSTEYITLFSRTYSFFYAYMLFAIILVFFFLILLFILHFLKTRLRSY